MYCYVWEFEVSHGKQSAFEIGYGPEGEWVQLFRRDPEYIRTVLLRDRDNASRFISIDFWTSREACEAFRERFESELEDLDARCEELTLRETHLGDFDGVE